MRKSTHALAAAAGLGLVLGVAVSPATADPAEPCAKQSAHVAKAEDALARVTKVFERQQAKVEKAKEVKKHADNASERARAKRAVKAAKEKKAHTRKAKKAQQQRLKKAQARLTDCLAAQG